MKLMALPAICARVARVRMTPRLPQSWIRQPITSTSFGFSVIDIVRVVPGRPGCPPGDGSE